MPRLGAEAAERRERAAHGPDHSEALARGLAILSAFGPERRQMTLAEAARAVDLPRATTRRALHTLSNLGLVECDGRLFRLTPRVLRLASGYLGSNGISTLLQPRCERISNATMAACSAAMLDGEDIVFVAYGQPARLLPFNGMIGTRLPAHCTALGRVLLAALPDAALDGFLASLRPNPITPRTETDPARIRAAILGARESGHALVEEEMELGFRSLAVPLRRYDGKVVAALNIGAPLALHPDGGMAERLLPLLAAEAAELGTQLI
ncbi:IclR family transcriptional regulator domain-containing protein [Roseomonas xinghualingensis]|uniref:IclR family transcriptional regulator domain-containing protein n=1 Tax=Roseomonas xinghualingensis TaxID=2986475 RepID=UPI0021F107F9|nr:IclR family transcriptional regulator C-terminal domain-containing protein [Roseomonas sp. SXEYE001]MCV4206847.1 helix-turn-helix domain-containing protein [Roseomonas sp. SXEYE001]